MDLNFVSVHENAKKKKLTLYPAILTEQAWSIKDVFFETKRFRLLWIKNVIFVSRAGKANFVGSTINPQESFMFT